MNAKNLTTTRGEKRTPFRKTVNFFERRKPSADANGGLNGRGGNAPSGGFGQRPTSTISTNDDYDGLRFSLNCYANHFVGGAARVVFLLRGYVPCGVYFISGSGDVQQKFIHTPSL